MPKSCLNWSVFQMKFVKAGVPQGSELDSILKSYSFMVLEPLFFLIHLSDLPQVLLSDYKLIIDDISLLMCEGFCFIT